MPYITHLKEGVLRHCLIKAFKYDIEKIEKLINDYSKDIVENDLFVMSNKDPKVFTNAFRYLKAIIENKSTKLYKSTSHNKH